MHAKRVKVDITKEVLARRRALEKQYLDAGYLVPLPTREEAKALNGISVYEFRTVTRAKNPAQRSAVNMSGPKEPIKVFARWDAVNGAYFEDADGAVWYQGVTGKPSRQRGTRAEVEERIVKGELRGKLVATKKNPAQRSAVAIKRQRKKKAKRAVKKAAPKKRSKTFAIYASKTAKSPRMHFDGKNFSQRSTIRRFPSVALAAKTARELIAKYPVLRKYRVTVEPPPRPL